MYAEPIIPKISQPIVCGAQSLLRLGILGKIDEIHCHIGYVHMCWDICVHLTCVI